MVLSCPNKQHCSEPFMCLDLAQESSIHTPGWPDVHGSNLFITFFSGLPCTTSAISSPCTCATIRRSTNRQFVLGGPTSLDTLPNVAAYLFLDGRFDQGQGQSHVFPCHHAVVLVRIFFPPGILCNFIKGEVLGLRHQVFQVSTSVEWGRANAWHKRCCQLKHARSYIIGMSSEL